MDAFTKHLPCYRRYFLRYLFLTLSHFHICATVHENCCCNAVWLASLCMREMGARLAFRLSGLCLHGREAGHLKHVYDQRARVLVYLQAKLHISQNTWYSVLCTSYLYLSQSCHAPRAYGGLAHVD
ncbi:hypothetical protein ACSS6W_010635 [Trichoderma asperelloides]